MRTAAARNVGEQQQRPPGPQRPFTSQFCSSWLKWALEKRDDAVAERQTDDGTKRQQQSTKMKMDFYLFVALLDFFRREYFDTVLFGLKSLEGSLHGAKWFQLLNFVVFRLFLIWLMTISSLYCRMLISENCKIVENTLLLLSLS